MFVSLRPTLRAPIAAFWAVIATTAAAHAQPARMVLNIHPDGAAFSSGSNPQNLTSFGGDLFFTARDSTDREGLWRSDGTAEGTRLVVSLVPSAMAVSGNRLLFLTANSLWTTDGTTGGTALVRVFSVCEGIGSSPQGPLVEAGGTVFFTAYDNSTGNELWKSDGTEEGTRLVKDIGIGPYGSDPRFLTALGNKVLFFRADQSPQAGELWVSDGTEDGTSLVSPFLPDFREVVSTIGGIFFNGCDLSSQCGTWRSDGTPGGTILLKPGFARILHGFGPLALFSWSDGVHGVELWASDGTPGGTTMLKDINPAGDTDFFAFETMDGRAYFAAQVSITVPPELWRTDGTPSGTEPVTTLPAQGPLKRAGSTLYIGMPNASPPQLWRSDGTAGGTDLVAELPSFGPSTMTLQEARGALVFPWFDDAHGLELWKSDGTQAGTGLVRDIHLEPIGSFPRSLTVLDGDLLFSADDGAHKSELWKSHGTPGTTTLVRDLNALPDAAGDPSNFAVLDHVALFAADADGAGRELWKSDGTEAGTGLIKDIEPGYQGSSPTALTTHGTIVVFTVNPGGLWASDGTGEGTLPISDSTLQVYPPFVEFDGALFFLGNDGVQHGLWKTDGSAAGAALVASLGPRDSHSPPRLLTRSGALLFFAAHSPETGFELWKSDGTQAGTGLVTEISRGRVSAAILRLTDVGGVLYFTAFNHAHQLWRSDGTAEGTRQVTSHFGSPAPSDLIAVNGTLFFTTDDCEHGRELWKTDGTDEGSVLIKDIWPGPASASPRPLAVLGGHLLFAAADAEHGEELWKSDGTEAGTLLFQDVNAGSAASLPASLQVRVLGSVCLFTATDGTHGWELWSVPASMVAGTAISPTSGPSAGATRIAVSGTYAPGTSVSIGGADAADVTIDSPSYLTATTPALPPGSLNDVIVESQGSPGATLPEAWFADFLDVPSTDVFHDFVESVVRAGISEGCGGGEYCGAAPITRAQMSVFLLKAEHGATYAPPSCTGIFADAPCPGPFTDWIERLAAENVTAGCGSGNYCPGASVTRAQMAVFLLKTKEGAGYAPPASVGLFVDVPAGSFASDWIEELHRRGITGGCAATPLAYCPGVPSTRGQMAVFVTRTFGL